MTVPEGPIDRIWLAFALLAVDPIGLGGLVLRGRAGPARAACLAALPDLGMPLRKLHPNISDDVLFGGMDVSATLTEGRPVLRDGVLSSPCAILLSMAERCSTDLAARLAIALDQGDRACVIALDEGVEADEHPPAPLTERLAFYIDINGLRLHDDAIKTPFDLAAARAALPEVSVTPEDQATLVQVAVRLGIDSLRAPLFALKTARCHAALQGRAALFAEDLEVAAALVFAHRATCLPEPEDSADAQPPAPPQDTDDTGQTGETTEDPGDLMVEAVRVSLPDGLLTLTHTRSGGTAGLGAGEKQQAKQRGRPLPARRGRMDGRSRVDLMATLRHAAPWQTLRRIPGRKVTVLPSDICLKRFETRTERVLIFAVDASGSAAHARLNEAKGAVEHLLARAYASRDRVALIGFRNTSAEVLLPPNRSLLMAKRRLSALPGGGATPLAHGLQAAGLLAFQARKQGMTPTLVLLTDGRGNVALDGSTDRQNAGEDAEKTALWLRGAGIQGLVLDTAIRPQKALMHLAEQMGATHLALPRSTAPRLSRAIETALGA